MALEKIYSIVGKPGLFEIISTNKSGAILESLLDKKRIQAFATDKLTSINDVYIYSLDGDVPLKDIIKNIHTKEKGGKCIDPKSDNNAIKNYMKEVLPNYDQDKVYVSDMKKLFTWYNLLITENKLDSLEDENTEESSNNDTEESK